jgi:hypothetical protein
LSYAQASASASWVLRLQMCTTTPTVCFDFFFFGGSRAWTQGLTLSHSASPFLVMGFFKIGSLELFAWGGFEPWSSWSLSPQ